MIDLSQYDAIKTPLKIETSSFYIVDDNQNIILQGLTQLQALRIAMKSYPMYSIKKA
jgi:hypothetical protein